MEIRGGKKKKKTWLETSTAADDSKAGCWLCAPVVQGKDAAEVTGLISMTNKGLTMHGFQGALFSFLWFYFIFFYFTLFYFCCFFCLISVFWPHPGEPSGFDFSLYGYMVNFLSHSSEMETFKYYIYIHFFFSLLIMLLVIYCRIWGQTKRVTVTRSL